ncbi:hypothetical protein C8Q73DRAFT_437392 [Cubamyces lactineus]|nr:hypothetical protein C8Q73DRAFT_437392 [Cubamyces lactineus]
MPADGPTLIHRARISDQGWIPDAPAYPNMTKDCRSAAVPTVRNNSGPGQSQMRSFVVQDTADMTPSTTMPAPPGTHSTRHQRPPPQPSASQNSNERLSHPLPQRPAGPHKPQLQSAADEVTRKEVCRNNIAGRCSMGDKCRRSHILPEGRAKPPQTTALQAPAPPPAPVATQDALYEIHPTVRFVNGAYTDRFSKIHRFSPDQLLSVLSVSGSGNADRKVASSHSNENTQRRDGRHEARPMQPISTVVQTSARSPSTPPKPARSSGTSTQSQRNEVLPENLNAERLSRAAEVDTRPARRSDEVCQAFQKGACLWGERCHRTHILLLPEACLTHLLPAPKKDKEKKVPAFVRYTAPDGTIRERETCKLGVKGLCHRGDNCRFAHDVQPITDSEEEMAESSDDAGQSVLVSSMTPPPSMSRTPSGQSYSQPQVNLPANTKPQGLEQKKSRPICRMHFLGRPCYRRPCRYSHDILDLAELPADNELVFRHADELQRALEMKNPELTSRSPSVRLPGSELVSDTAKKRLKKPRKPGSVDTESIAHSSEGPSRTAGSHQRGVSEGKDRRSHPVVELVSSRDRAGEKHVTVSQSSTSSGNLHSKSHSESTADESTASTAYHSASEPQLEVPRASGSGDINQRASLPCFNYVHGRCSFQNCRYSHEIDREAMRADFFERLGKPRRSRHRPDAKDTPPQASAPRDPVIRKTGRKASTLGKGSHTSGPYTDSPAVPPGLGLENRDLMKRDGQDASAKAPPESFTITILDSTKATFGPGLQISQIITGFECRQILLEGVPSTFVPAAITALLERFGAVTYVAAVDPSPGDSTLSFRVTFATGDAAIEAATALNDGQLVAGAQISASVVEKKAMTLGGGTLFDGDVLFDLPTPFQTGFVGYPTEELARKAIALARTAKIDYSRVSATLYEGIPMVGTFSVRFDGLPPNFTTDDLKKHFVQPLDAEEREARRENKKRAKRNGKGKGVDQERDVQPSEKCEGAMLQRAKYPSVSSAINGLRRMLQEHDEEVTLNVLPPPYGKCVKVWAHFSSADVAAKACGALHGFNPRFVGKQRIFAHHIKSLRYSLPCAVFDVLAPEIDYLRSYIGDDCGTSITVIDRRPQPGPITVKLLSESMASLTKAKASFDRLLRGEKVTDNGQIVWNDFFGGQAGESFLQELEQRYPKVKISIDPRRRTLALFGVSGERERVQNEIIDKVKNLKSRALQRHPIPGHLIVGFMRSDLVKLQQEFGKENVWVDLTNQKLVVRGDEDCQKVAQLAILHTRQQAPHHPRGGGDACPVCFEKVSRPVTLTCGHTWCKDCLVSYLKSSVDNKSFPLTCLANEARCAQPISITIVQMLLAPEEFDAVVNAAFTAYVQERPNEFHYCPTPDCPQVYRKSARKLILQCPSCLVRICPHCNMEAHESVSCQDSNPEDVVLFEEWKMGHDVKDCPSCKVPIERTAGCNHMTCVSCKVHICWVCLATFSLSGEVYDHMRSIHGGIGL